MGKTVLGLLVTMVIVSVATAMTPITCTAGEFSKCQTGSVTCHFHENIKKSKKNFNIVQYPFNKGSSNSDAGTYVLVCNWGQGEALDCKTEDGFGFNKQVSDTITLDVLDVKSSVGGVYVCQLVPDGGIPLETCTLKVKDLVYQYPTDVCPDVNCGSEEVIIAVLILILIILIILLVFVIVFIRKRFNCVRKQGDPITDHCICCGFTYSIQRKPRTVLFENNKAERGKRVGATSEEASLLAGSNLKASSYNYPIIVQDSGDQTKDFFLSDDTNDGNGRGNRKPGSSDDNKLDTHKAKQRSTDDTKPDPRNAGPDKAPLPSTSRTHTTQAQPSPELITPVSRPPPAHTVKESGAQQIKAFGYGDWTTDQVAEWLRHETFDDDVIGIVTNAKLTGKNLLHRTSWLGNDKTEAELQKLKPRLDDKQVNKINAKIKELRAKAAAEETSMKKEKNRLNEEEKQRKELEKK